MSIKQAKDMLTYLGTIQDATAFRETLPLVLKLAPVTKSCRKYLNTAIFRLFYENYDDPLRELEKDNYAIFSDRCAGDRETEFLMVCLWSAIDLSNRQLSDRTEETYYNSIRKDLGEISVWSKEYKDFYGDNEVVHECDFEIDQALSLVNMIERESNIKKRGAN
jgi:hypothetical protein